ncbi:hypothetical protein AHF37_08383, partial [Paragonimus kellicotti]
FAQIFPLTHFWSTFLPSLLFTVPPEFIQPQSHVEHSFDEDDATTLHCGIKRRAFPGSIVYWEKDQRVLKKYTTNSLILEDNGETLRFPKLRPEDQGQYQCFVETDGYAKRAAGQEQTLVVKGMLHLIRYELNNDPSLKQTCMSL